MTHGIRLFRGVTFTKIPPFTRADGYDVSGRRL